MNPYRLALWILRAVVWFGFGLLALAVLAFMAGLAWHDPWTFAFAAWFTAMAFMGIFGLDFNLSGWLERKANPRNSQDRA